MRCPQESDQLACILGLPHLTFLNAKWHHAQTSCLGMRSSDSPDRGLGGPEQESGIHASSEGNSTRLWRLQTISMVSGLESSSFSHYLPTHVSPPTTVSQSSLQTKHPALPVDGEDIRVKSAGKKGGWLEKSLVFLYWYQTPEAGSHSLESAITLLKVCLNSLQAGFNPSLKRLLNMVWV